MIDVRDASQELNVKWLFIIANIAFIRLSATFISCNEVVYEHFNAMLCAPAGAMLCFNCHTAIHISFQKFT